LADQITSKPKELEVYKKMKFKNDDDETGEYRL
jgi:hypothetical protein